MQLTATGQASGAMATASFTDAAAAPTLMTKTSDPLYIEDAAAVALYSETDVTLGGTDKNQSIVQLKLTVSNVMDGGSEILRIDGTDIALVTGSGTTATNFVGYSVSVSGGTATVSLTRSPGLSTGMTALRADGMSYRNSSQDPTAGSRVVTLTYLKDDGNGTGANQNATTLSWASRVTVEPVNDAPTLDAISNPVAILEDSGQQTINLSGISAVESGQSVTVTAVSSNPGLIPNPTVNYTSPNGTGSLSYTPVANANGTATITLTVTDNGGADGDFAAAGGELHVNSYSYSDQIFYPSGGSHVTAMDSAGNFVVAWMSYGQDGSGWGIYAQRYNAAGEAQGSEFRVNTTTFSHQIYPSVAMDETGNLIIAWSSYGQDGSSYGIYAQRYSVSRGVNSSTRQFTVTVTPVNDAPSFTKGADQTVFDNAGPQTISDWATALSAGPADEANQTLSFLVSNDNSALFTTMGQPSVSSDGTLSFTPKFGSSGTSTVTVRIKDDGGTLNNGVDTSTAQTFTITVNLSDTTAPTTTATSSGQTYASGHSGWNNDSVTVDLDATDNDGGSGVKQITYWATGAGSFTSRTVTSSTDSFSITAEGSTTVHYYATDNAGNTEPEKTLTVKLDKTAPTLTFGSTGANAAGWNNADVSLSYTTADNLSGVSASSPSSPLSFTTETDGTTQTVTVTDVAGNSQTFTSPVVKLDKTKPVTTLVSQNETAGTTTIFLSASDNLSGVYETHYVVDGASD